MPSKAYFASMLMIGDIPAELSQLSRLNKLNLCFNGFSGNSRMHTSVSNAYAMNTGSIPAEFSQLLNLQELILNDCTLSG